MKYIIIVIVVFLGINYPLFAQHEDKNWYFGNSVDGIVFDNNNNPVKVSNKYSNGSFGFEGMIVVSNANTGDLLFYSDGILVINKNHAVMTNGTGLSANNSNAQGVQCCPIPGSCFKKYYLFTSSAMDQTNGSISYSIVDFTTNPLGVVTNLNTAVPAAGSSAEGMCIVNKPNTNDYWLIVSQGSTASYKVVPITSAGIGISATYTFANTGSSYQMNYSKTAQKLVVTGYGNKKVTVINFNPTTGVLSNEVQLGSIFTSSTGAARFSPDGSKLYATDASNLWQYNFATSIWTNMNTNAGIPHDVKVGPDGRMYHLKTYNSAQPMAVIDFPNLTAIGNVCNYHLLTFNPAFVGQTRRFPEFVTVSSPPIANVDNYTLNSLSAVTFNVLINDTDPQGDSIFLDSIILAPSHGIAVINNGQINYIPDSSTACGVLDTLIYKIKNINCATDTALVIINNMSASFLVSLGNDTSVCQGNTININAANPSCSYLWNTGQTTQTINVNTPGMYYVKVTNSIGCINYDTINISIIQPTADFIISDTVCLNQNITIQNASLCASSYYWNFCSGNLSSTPIGINMGNLGSLSNPVYSAIAKDGNNYFVFITNHTDGTLTRLSFGNSLINIPTASNLGSLGVMGQYIEAIQIKKDGNGNWYGFVAGGQNNYLGRISFGTSLANAPTMVNLGNIGSTFNYPHSLYIFQENNNWFGFVSNINNSTIVRLSFGSSLANTPTAINLGNIGGLNYPLGLVPVLDNGTWYLFIVNRNSNSLSRLNFGNSLLNTPTGINLGSVNSTMNVPRFISIIRDCNQVFGFVVNEGSNIVRLTFPTGLTSTPAGTNLGNIANFSFPHHISELFRVGDSLYTFVMNVSNNTISRLCFPSCNNSSVSSSSLQNPPVFSYNSTGTFNVSLVVNEGLPTQSNICKQVVVTGPPIVNLGNDTSICQGTIILNAGNSGCTYLWNTSQTTQSITITNPGTYWVKVTKPGGCFASDTIIVSPSISAANFTIPDTVCVNQNIVIQNTSSCGSTYYWNFCSGNINTSPQAINLGNIGLFNGPVYTEIVKDGSNYYVFVTNNTGGTLSRLFYGNSLLNTPVAVNLGNIGGVIPTSIEDIHIENENGNWYGIAVGGAGGTSRIIRLNFGASLANNPTAVNMGNIGGMNYPQKLQIFKSGGNWYGFTVSRDGNSITRFSFGNSLANTPTGLNLGNIGVLNIPDDISLILVNNNWYAYIINEGSNTITRLEFGNSLLNIPVATNTGNPGGLNGPRGISVFTDCNNIIGLIVNRYSNDLVTLNFPTGATGSITGTSVGNIANFSFPHSIKRFRVGDTLYAFIPNVNNNTLSRIYFPSCNNSSVSSSTLQNPPVFSYNSTGTYNVSLVVNEGLPSQSNFCRQVVVIALPTVNIGNDTTICQGNNLLLNAANPGSNYLWNTGQTTQTLSVTNSGMYSVKVTNTAGCFARDTVNVNIIAFPVLNLGNDTTICIGNSVILSGPLVSQNACIKANLPLNLQQSLVAFYPFCGNANDESGLGNNGTVNGATLTTDRFGNANRAYSFNGLSNYISRAPLSDMTALTVSVWVYHTNGSNHSNIICDMNNTVGNDFYMSMSQSSVGIRADKNGAQLALASGWGGASPPPQALTNLSLENQWKHIVWLMYPNYSKIYINGILTGTFNYTGSNIGYHTVTNIGRLNDGVYDGNYFKGKIDDIFIYNRTLSEAEIQQLYTLGSSLTYHWSTADTTQSITVTPTQTNTYSLTVSNGNCVSIDSIKVTLAALPLVNLGNDTSICQGNTLILNANNSGSSYLWNTGQTTQTINVSTQGNYSVKVTNNNGCFSKDTIIVSFLPQPSVNLGNDTSICQGNNVALNAFSSGCVYLWNNGQTTSGINVSTSGIYSVKVTSNNGCFIKDTINVTVVPGLIVNLGNDTSICQGDVLILNAGNNGGNFLWNTGMNSQTISVQNPGMYWVMVTNNNCHGSDTINVNTIQRPVFSLGNDTIMCPGELIILTPGIGFSQYFWSDGSSLSYLNVNNPGNYSVIVYNGLCTSSDSIFIDECSSEIWVPNVFTPNGDGINEFFFPVCTNIDKITLYIYNRWGMQLFEGSNKSAIWDGKYNGELCPDGVYYYLIEYEHKGNTKGMRQLHGSVTLL